MGGLFGFIVLYYIVKTIFFSPSPFTESSDLCEDEEDENLTFIDLNSPDFLPNLELFKKRALAIAEIDIDTRLYLYSRKVRLYKINKNRLNNEANKH